MKILTRSLFALAAAACLACVAVASRTLERASDFGAAVLAGVKTFAVHVVDVLAPATAGDREPAVRILQAKEFVQRTIRRKNLLVTDGWRMCPSV